MMSTETESTETESSAEPVRRKDQVEFLALASIQRLRRVVSPLPVSAQSEDQQRKFRELVAWYERVCVDDRYSNPPPVDGVEALFAMPLGNSLHDRFVSIVRDAIRVAEELVRYRQLVGNFVRADPRSCEIARARLELSILSTRARLDEFS